jgi:hypothetical protein
VVGTMIIPSDSTVPNYTVQDFFSPVSHDLSDKRQRYIMSCVGGLFVM